MYTSPASETSSIIRSANCFTASLLTLSCDTFEASLTNSVDPDQTAPVEAGLDPHCLLLYLR